MLERTYCRNMPWLLTALLGATVGATDLQTAPPRPAGNAAHEAPAPHAPSHSPMPGGTASAQPPFTPRGPAPPPYSSASHGPRSPTAPVVPAVPAKTNTTTLRNPATVNTPITARPASPLRPNTLPPTVKPAAPVSTLRAPPAVAHDALHGPAATIDARTTVQPRIDHSGYRITHIEPRGTRLVVAEHRGATGDARVVAYRETASAGGQTVARDYADGHRVVQGAKFRSEGVLGRPQYVTYSNGLHAAYLPTGRPLYAERYATTTVGDGPPVRVLQRLYYQRYRGPDGGEDWIPVVRTYPWVATIAGIELFAYLAPIATPGYYMPLYRPVATPIVVGPDCAICPSNDVSFEAPAQAYTDPMDLVGDRVIGDAVAAPVEASPGASDTTAAPAAPATESAPAIGSSTAPVDPIVDRTASAPPPAPELVTGSATTPAEAATEIAALRGATTALQTSVDRQATATPALADSLPQAHAVPALLIEAASGADRPATGAAALAVPREAQEQLRKEVRFAIALQRNHRSLQLPEILQADYGKIFVFQATVPIDVMQSGSTDQCTLSSGDLLDFAHVPAAGAALVDMHVISSRPGHCPAGAGVQLGISDLQDMLNSFSERVEHEATTVNSCMSPGGACVRI